MKFNSILHLIYFVAILSIYGVVPSRWKTHFLTICSYGLYWSIAPRLVPTLFSLTTIAYFAGIAIEKSNERMRRIYMMSSLGLAIGTLFYFKYLNFFIFNFSRLSGHPQELQFSESIGLSFIVFLVISYILDVFFRTISSEQKFFDFALYVAFFPKLLQGPLERASDFLPQIKLLGRLRFENLKAGLLLLIWGLFLKLVIADRIADMYTDPVYADVGRANTSEIFIAVLGYPLQLYFDFLGYSTSAIGAALCFGIKLSENFNRPLLAVSCADFWRRWHMTLSKWLQDYLFLPLQMSFRNLGNHGTALAFLITFAIAGVWHGASWGFAIFGLIHGVWLALEFYSNLFLRKRKRLKKFLSNNSVRPVKIVFTYWILSLSFVVFRAPKISVAKDVFEALWAFGEAAIRESSVTAIRLFSVITRAQDDFVGTFNIVALIAALCLFHASSNLVEDCKANSLGSKSQWLLTETVLIFVLTFGIFSGASFAYFKF